MSIESKSNEEDLKQKAQYLLDRGYVENMTFEELYQKLKEQNKKEKNDKL